MATPVAPITLRRYEEDESDEINDFGAVEVNCGEVDLIVSPYTTGARTYSFTPEQTWTLIRELARAASAAEQWESEDG